MSHPGCSVNLNGLDAREQVETGRSYLIMEDHQVTGPSYSRISVSY